MAMKEITIYQERKCSNCKQPIHKGEKALYIVNEELFDRIIVHISCPRGFPGAFTKWRRPRPLPQIKKINIKCANCKHVFSTPADKGIPLKCHFCGTMGVCEVI